MSDRPPDYLDRMTDKLVAQIGQRSASFQTNHDGGSSFLPHNMNGSPFRASNALTLAAEGQAQGYTDPRWLTRPQAERMGGRIPPHETGTPVQYWQHVDGRPTMTTAVVFNAQQVNGLPPYERQVAAMEDRAAAVAAIVSGSHAVVERIDGPPRYDRNADVIRLTDRPAGDNLARQQQEAVAALAAWTNHPSRIERVAGNDPASAAREQLRTTIAAMLVSDRLKIGFQGANDPMLARGLSVLVRDRSEISRAAMTGEMVAQEIVKYGNVRAPELSQERMQALAVEAKRLSNNEQRERAWAAATSGSTHSRQNDVQAQRQTMRL